MQQLHRFGLIAVLAALVFMIVPLDAFAQRRGGGSFGGSRGRGFSGQRSSPGGSFGGSRGSSRATPPRSGRDGGASRFGNAPTTRNSFGGSRLNSSGDYVGRYGAPRATERRTMAGANGNTNYTINRYGGMGDGFMMGYMMGSIPWYWSMPFHPAYYFSRPATVVNPDGTTAVYPGTFQWGTLFITLLVVGGIVYIGYVWLRNRRRRMAYTTSGTMAASYDDDQRPGAQSSFM
jgi:cbb3-type cytochrome oxidase subunit 3